MNQTEQKANSLNWPVAAAIVLCALSLTTMCLCGHMNMVSLLFTLPAAVLAWWGFMPAREKVFERIGVVFVVIVASLLLAKNIGDILWFGHRPLFE